jgi:hypothetical protein
MQYRAKLSYDKNLAKRAVWAFWRRSLGIVAMIAPFAFIALLVQSLMSVNQSWYVGSLIAGTLITVGLPIVVYLAHYQNSMAKLREMGNPVAIFVADDESFTLTADIGSSTFKWSTIEEIWKFDGFWLLLFSRAHFATIPLEEVSDDMRTFVSERVAAAGGKVDP